MSASDIDLDVISFGNTIKDSETESVIYLRGDESGVFVYYNGMTDKLVNSAISAMSANNSLYDVLSASVDLFESDSIQVLEEDGEIHIENVFEQHNLICSAIVTMFAEKHHVSFDGWVSHIVGGKAVFGKDVLNFTDIVYDIESSQPQNVIWEFQDSDKKLYREYCEWLENNSHYCDGCDSAIHYDDVDWMNDTLVCPECGKKLSL